MSKIFEERFLSVIRNQLQGLSSKVDHDFSKGNFDDELAKLHTDPVYEKFAFDRPEYVLVRFMGRISISIGRRLGEIYDKIPRFAAAARFNLLPQQIAPRLGGLELDIGLHFSDLSQEDQQHVSAVYKKYTNIDLDVTGLGIEIRYNFNPNDSSRLRKDVEMGQLLLKAGLKPVYLVFSSISPRKDAISRLTASGWTFLVGEPALAFISELLNVDIQSVLDQPLIKEEIKKIVDGIMDNLVSSYAFRQLAEKHKDKIT